MVLNLVPGILHRLALWECFGQCLWKYCAGALEETFPPAIIHGAVERIERSANGVP